MRILIDRFRADRGFSHSLLDVCTIANVSSGSIPPAASEGVTRRFFRLLRPPERIPWIAGRAGAVVTGASYCSGPARLL
jgi:hypothetical protein